MVSGLRPILPATRPLLTRGYAAAVVGNPKITHAPDTRQVALRTLLYPTNAYDPTSSTPTGTYHPNHLARLAAVIPSAEAHETIERAWNLYQRELREGRKVAMVAQFKSMVAACDELERITNPENGGPFSETGKGGLFHRQVYRNAVAQIKQASRRGPQPKGKKTPEQKWLETRVEGLVPRESWVPVESRGKGWDYDWQRPKA